MDAIWAITTYYNPASYKARRRNYELFRKNLGIPLLTVEMSTGCCFELTSEDAEILVKVSGGACLWQKERLLNVALDHLPPEVKNVCWVDCDVIFEDRNWAVEVVRELKLFHLVQCFTELVDLPEGIDDIAAAPVGGWEITGRSIASLEKSGEWVEEDFVPSTTRRFRQGLCGLAWAARRSLLERHRFYDAMIVGSGDRALACAAVGRPDDAIMTARMSPARVEHYLRWAIPLQKEIDRAVGVRSGRLFHLWHGSIANRRYLERHEMLASLNFEPERDLVVSPGGAWQWNSNVSLELREALENYFSTRQEDGAIQSIRS
ncbi:hypothetical protein F6R97_26840 [Pseudomonas sp. JV414]|uniref:hypothetical protein n=1 Tax=Pseudomonas sp. JV414 TaxID=1733110 RepID=UPI0028E0AB71|nr:hypothetical protein [Pseudomonas sp. JV414]MDT9678140.1 hypothetical protein [Pseudomonas sp. JV414]